MKGYSLMLLFLAVAPAAADEDVVSSTLHAVRSGTSAKQAEFVDGVIGELASARAKNNLTIEQPYDWSTLAQPKSGDGRMVYLDRNRTISISKSAGLAEVESASFRRQHDGSIIRQDTHTMGGMFGPMKTLSTSYSDGTGKSLSNLSGSLKWKMAKSPLLAPRR